MKYTTVSLYTFILLSGLCSAADMVLDELCMGVSQELEAPKSDGEYYPYQHVRLPDGEQFVIVYATFSINWAEQEEVAYTFEDVSLKGPDGQTYQPIGRISPDRRITPVSSLKFQELKASKKRKDDELRFGAIFVTPAANTFELIFAGKTYDKYHVHPLPEPAKLATISMISCELNKNLGVTNNTIKRCLPTAEVKVHNPHGKLLLIEVLVDPQAPNVNGSDFRYTFSPAEFRLMTPEGYQLEPIGSQAGNFTISSIWNVSADNLDALKKKTQRITLIFSVPATFTQANLSFRGIPCGEIDVSTP